MAAIGARRGITRVDGPDIGSVGLTSEGGGAAPEPTNVRAFDGTDDKIVLGGTGTALCNGAHTIVVIAKPLAFVSDTAYVGVQNGASTLLGSLVNGGGTGRLGYNTATPFSVAEVGVTQDVWQIFIAGKSTGTNAIQFSRKELGAGSWTHADGGTIANQAGTCDRVELGAYLNGGFGSPCEVLIACAALFATNLSQANRESIQTTPSTARLAALGAVALWDLNQADTGTGVLDLVGSADQSALTGTTVVTDDPPTGWTFGT